VTGRYYHNLRPGGATSGRGLNTTHFFDHDAVFPTLHRAGYQTALFGKIHNNQAEWLCHPSNHTEPFTHIETECSPCGNYFPKAFVTKSSDAKYTSMETLAPDDPRTHYSHAQYGNRSVAFIKQAAKSTKPWFVFVGTTGPHLPAEPAPWHQTIADNLKGSDGVCRSLSRSRHCQSVCVCVCVCVCAAALLRAVHLSVRQHVACWAYCH
jgi:arylsulfatase A-like enzyme